LPTHPKLSVSHPCNGASGKRPRYR
jgi:hypothetical protein